MLSTGVVNCTYQASYENIFNDTVYFIDCFQLQFPITCIVFIFFLTNQHIFCRKSKFLLALRSINRNKEFNVIWNTEQNVSLDNFLTSSTRTYNYIVSILSYSYYYRARNICIEGKNLVCPTAVIGRSRVFDWICYKWSGENRNCWISTSR